MIAYLIESSLCLLLMLLVYRVFLSKTSLHQLKRVFLLACLLAPLVLPLMTFNIYYDQPVSTTKVALLFDGSDIQSPETYSIPDTALRRGAPVLAKTDSSTPVDWEFLLYGIYSLVAFLFLVRFWFYLRRLRQVTRQSDSKWFEGYRLLLQDQATSPYSFFRLIFMGRPDYDNPVIREQLLTHELVHVRQWHSLDVVAVELVKIICWFNPLYTFLARYIRLNHEFIADAGVISQNHNSQTYQHLLLSFYQQPRVSSPLVSPSDYSFIKTRFQMMQHSTSRKAALLRLSFLVPILIGIFFSLAMEFTPRPINDMENEVNSDSTEITKLPTGFPIEGVLKKVKRPFDPLKMAETITFSEKYPGIDITATPGRMVIATGEGMVERTGQDDELYGNYLLIRHAEDYKTLYASMSEVKVKSGETIKMGQQLGSIGTSMKEWRVPEGTDRVHYAVWKSGEWVNPYDYLDIPVIGNITSSRVHVITWDQAEKPNGLPFDVSKGQFMSYTGSSKGSTPKITSVYDTAIGTEFFSLPATLIKTTAAGTVTEVVKNHEWYGNYVKVRHNEVYETMYAKLDQVNVTEGQSLSEGADIGQIGRPGEMFGRVHYKIIKDGAYVMMDVPHHSKMSRGPGFLFIRGFEKPPSKYGLNGHYVPWKFPKGFNFTDVYYDREKALFVKPNGEVITKPASELNDTQKAALLSFKARPIGSRDKKRPVPEEVYSRWEKPWVYKITIDGQPVDSKEMVNYKPEDFVHCGWVVVSKEVKERNGYAFELWLWTETHYQQYLEQVRKADEEWRNQTKKILAQFDGF